MSKMLSAAIDAGEACANNSHSKRSKVCAVVFNDRQLCSIGYNGTSRGLDNLCESPDGVTKDDVVHAEINALIKDGAAAGTSMFVTLSPCLQCASVIINSNIKVVYFAKYYRDRSGLGLLQKAGMQTKRVKAGGRTYDDASDAFENLAIDLYDDGDIIGNTLELTNISFSYDNKNEPKFTSSRRKFNRAYAEKEFEWYKSGDRNISAVSEAKIWHTCVVPETNNEANSNYGFFWKTNDQLKRMVDLLKASPNTRRAVVVHYDIRELDRYAYDTPCNIYLQLMIRKGRLLMTVYARSIDVVYGFCNDAYCFHKLHALVAEEVGCEVGSIFWNVGSLHLYEKHFSLAKAVKEDFYKIIV